MNLQPYRTVRDSGCSLWRKPEAAQSLHRRKTRLLRVAELFLQSLDILLVQLDLVLVFLQPVENPLIIFFVAGPDRFLLGQFRLGLCKRLRFAAEFFLENPAAGAVPVLFG